MKRDSQAGTGRRRGRWHLFAVLVLAVTCLGLGQVQAATAKAGADTELLEAEKAFQVTARRIGENRVELRYAIADGYYMYRDRFRFVVDGQPVVLGKKAWPGGKLKQDATFGKVITYRKSVHLLLPISSTANAPDGALTLIVTSQGCADAGVCYPPLRQILALPAKTSGWMSPTEEAVAGFSHDRQSGGGLADRLTNGK